ncbi:biotin--[acetyl-CoA-carboxylase] ligase [Hydrogenophaga sp. 5NK40-0174]|uniref:biotin--[acetyl-CoA-carboxylase] ligase n=1 Tax=Hydrogenophaga sp. 5NK40-0174 TaxID=3127649 RepID=UPI0031084F53
MPPTPLTLAHHAENLWQALHPLWPDFSVEVLPSIDSTNTELMRRARQGLDRPELLVAEVQTAGRGRLGKSWHSEPGQSLAFSLAVPMAPQDWSGLSLAVGVSVAQALGEDVMLKWPNDLWYQGRKLGGILVETAMPAQPAASGSARVAVIGIGINIARPPGTAVQLAPHANGLPPVAPAGLAEIQMGVTAGEALEAVCKPLATDIGHFVQDGFAAFLQRFRARDALAGCDVVLSDGTQGVASGVDADGALLVRTGSGMRAINSSEVSVRPC